jgi:DNA-binding CsgD family transcriptional regulator
MRTHFAGNQKRDSSGKVTEPPPLEQLIRLFVDRVTSATTSPSKITESAPLEELIRLLVSRVTPAADEGSTAVTQRYRGEQIIFDCELGDARYLLVRMSTPRRTAVSLSSREQEIVRMVAEGYPNKIIADVLEISPCTVGTHLRRIFAKLGVSSRAAMVACQLTTGAVGDLSALALKPTKFPRAVESNACQGNTYSAEPRTTSDHQGTDQYRLPVDGKQIAGDRNGGTPNRKDVSQRSVRSPGS